MSIRTFAQICAVAIGVSGGAAAAPITVGGLPAIGQDFPLLSSEGLNIFFDGTSLVGQGSRNTGGPFLSSEPNTGDVTPIYIFQDFQIDFDVTAGGVGNTGNLAGGAGLIIRGCDVTTQGALACVRDPSATETLLVANAVDVGSDPDDPTTLTILWEVSSPDASNGILAGEFFGNTTPDGDPLADGLILGTFTGIVGFDDATDMAFNNPFGSLAGNTVVAEQRGLFLIPVPGALPLMLSAVALTVLVGARRRRAAA